MGWLATNKCHRALIMIAVLSWLALFFLFIRGSPEKKQRIQIPVEFGMSYDQVKHVLGEPLRPIDSADVPEPYCGSISFAREWQLGNQTVRIYFDGDLRVSAIGTSYDLTEGVNECYLQK